MARGARMVEYWHWHSIHYGHEQYWLGVLNHDGEPGRCYDEVKRIAGEFERAGEAVVGLEPDADVAMLYSRESKWAMEFHPPLAVDGGIAPTEAPTSASSRASTRACSAPACRPRSFTPRTSKRREPAARHRC